MLALRRTLLCAAAIAAGTAMLALPAIGSAATKTKVVVSLKFPAFHGKLKSSKRACVANRKVKLMRKRRGPDKVMRRDRSNRKGRWSTPISRGKRVMPGVYYVKATKRGNCKAATSRRLVIPKS